jgi:DNA topoisomerase-6 subunit B
VAKHKEKEKTGARPGRKGERPQLDLFAAEAPGAAASAPNVRSTQAPPSPPPAREPAAEVASPPAPRVSARAQRVTAESLASKQREISVSEFFAKNRHLLGFDNPSKALLTTIKEAVDNSLDACEEASILPELRVEVHDLALEAVKQNPELTKGEGRFLVVVQDNGPGIVKAQVPKIFGKLLYGSKFFRLKQSRGQQGIGISAAAMYGQITTGKPIRVTSRVGKRKPAHVFDIQLDTRKNEPVVTHDEMLPDWHQEHGTRVELEIVANWQTGQRFVNRYVEHTALANPHAAIHYTRPVAASQRSDHSNRPGNETLSFPRAASELPKEAVEIKPHPHGVELGSLMLLARESKSRDVRGFLQTAFSRVSSAASADIMAKVSWGKKPVRPRVLGENRAMAEELHKAIAATKLMSPPTNCLSPIGDELIRKGLVSFLSVIESEGDAGDENAQLDLDSAGMKPAKKAGKGKAGAGKPQAAAEPAHAVPDASAEEGVEKIKGHNYFIATVTRPPKVYRGNPFQVEVGLAYGGSWPADKTIELFRFANRVPLLFQRGACGVTEAVVRTDWRNYLLSQPKGSLPVGPMALLVHIASVWVPFTSESKEAVAHYPDIIKEIQLAAQECGRKLATFIRKRKAADYQAQRRSIFELYIEEVAAAIGNITGRKPGPIKREFLQVAHEVTAAELQAEEKAQKLEARSVVKKTVARPEAEE